MGTHAGMEDWKKDVSLHLGVDQIAKRVAQMGMEIDRATPAGETLHMICVLRGAFVFAADLVRAIDRPVHCDFIGVSSYGAATESSGTVRLTQDLSSDIGGAHVLIVEDIIDTGLSMDYLKRNISTRSPASLRTCTLLDKPSRRKVDVKADHIGFEIPDVFVVGYGLDAAQRFRNLPFIGVYHGTSCD